MNRLGELPYMDAIDVSAVRLWGYNRYDAHPCEPWHNGTLQYVQSYGAETGTVLVNDPDGKLAAGCGGGGGNQAPSANAQNVVVRQNRSLAIQLSGSDPNGDKLTYAIVSGQGPSSGTLSNFDASTGKVTYTPNLDFTGNDSFTFTVNDGTWTSQPATISIKVIVPVPVDPKELRFHCRLDETSGTTASDSSGNGNHGTLTNGPSWVPGKVAGALQFDGVDDFVEHPDSTSLDVTGNMTISLWAKISSLTANNGAFVTKSQNGKQGNAAANTAYTFGISYASVTFTLSDGQVDALVSGPKGTIDDDAWHHLVALRDGATLKIYKDGAELYTATIDSAFSIQDTPFTLRLNADGAYDAQRFTGLMDDVRIFNRALTEGEILTLASASEEPPRYGDTNQDGVFSLADLVKLARWMVGLDPTPPSYSPAFIASDVADRVPDKTLNLRDLNSFAQKLVGKITCFPVEDCS